MRRGESAAGCDDFHWFGADPENDVQEKDGIGPSGERGAIDHVEVITARPNTLGKFGVLTRGMSVGSIDGRPGLKS